MSDTLTTLGKVLAHAMPRDAVHVAVMCCTAAETLRPGQHIGIEFDKAMAPTIAGVPHTVGIVDPFLTRPVLTGQKFWLFLYPNTVTGMTHHWQHPEIPDAHF